MEHIKPMIHMRKVISFWMTISMIARFFQCEWDLNELSSKRTHRIPNDF